MFYANLNCNFYKGKEGEVWGSVSDTRIVLDCNLLGIILGWKSIEMDLSDFQINKTNRHVFHDIFYDNTIFEFKNHNFRPKARLVHLILQQSLTPRSGNFNNPTLKVCKALFVIYGRYDIN